MPRLLQLVLFASMLLFLPTFLYLSHTGHNYDLIEYTPSGFGAIPPGAQGAPGAKDRFGKLFHPAGQISQGNGPASNAHKLLEQSNQFYKECLMNHGVKIQDLYHCKQQLEKQPKPSEKAPKESADDGADSGGGKLDKAIMPKMANATAKAELGHATWHFLHTMSLRFPEKPTPEESKTFKDFMHLFSLLYPCGDCANHFQGLLKQYPPQASSRKSASLWLCSMHNRVNARLGKPDFDCGKLDESYDCGCGIDSTPPPGVLGTHIKAKPDPVSPARPGARA